MIAVWFLDCGFFCGLFWIVFGDIIDKVYSAMVFFGGLVSLVCLAGIFLVGLFLVFPFGFGGSGLFFLEAGFG